MRLGQIKRIYGIEAAKVVSFLSEKNVEISKHPNSKVTDEQLLWVLDEFKSETPEVKVKEKSAEGKIAEVKQESIEDKPYKTEKKTEPKLGEIIEIPKEKKTKKKEVPSEKNEGEIEVIRAPKIEIEGVKVLGKIDLPEPKEEEIKEISEEVTSKEKEVEKIIDPLAHVHPSKRAKVKANKIKSELPKIKIKNTDYSDEKEIPKKEKKVKTKPQDQNLKKGKKKKQLERDKKIALAKKVREAQENLKKQGYKREKKVQPQRIQVRADGTIIPKHEQEGNKDKNTSLFARFWKWFNS